MVRTHARLSTLMVLALLIISVGVLAQVSTTDLVFALDCEGDTTDSAGTYDGLNDILDYSTGDSGQQCDFTRANQDFINLGDADDLSLTDGVSDVPFTIFVDLTLVDFTPDWSIPNPGTAGSLYVLNKDDTFGNREYALWFNVNGMNWWMYDGSTQVQMRVDGNEFNDGERNTLMLTCPGTEDVTDCKTYLNGVQAPTTYLNSVYNGMVNLNEPLSIGAFPYNPIYFYDGSMDRIYLWKGTEYGAQEAVILNDPACVYPFTACDNNDAPVFEEFFISNDAPVSTKETLDVQFRINDDNEDDLTLDIEWFVSTDGGVSWSAHGGDQEQWSGTHVEYDGVSMHTSAQGDVERTDTSVGELWLAQGTLTDGTETVLVNSTPVNITKEKRKKHCHRHGHRWWKGKYHCHFNGGEHTSVSHEGLVFALDCEGDTTDSAGNHHALNDIVDYVPGVKGQACDLTPAHADYIDMGDHDDFTWGDGVTDTSYSVSMWVNIHDLNTGQSPTIWAKRHRDNLANTEQYVYFDADGQLYVTLWDQNTDAPVTYSNIRNYPVDPVFTENEWVHVVVTYDGSAMSQGIDVYVDGVLVDSTYPAFGPGYVAMQETDQELMFGAEGDLANVPERFMDGSLDMMYFFKDRVLTAQEVELLYNGGEGCSYPFEHCDNSAPVFEEFSISNEPPVSSAETIDVQFAVDDEDEDPLKLHITWHVSRDGGITWEHHTEDNQFWWARHERYDGQSFHTRRRGDLEPWDTRVDELWMAQGKLSDGYAWTEVTSEPVLITRPDRADIRSCLNKYRRYGRHAARWCVRR